MKQVWSRGLSTAAALSLLVHAGCDRTSRLDDPAGVRLNEVMAQNVSVPVPDASGTPVTLNWVEIHNTLSTSMNLGRYGLTDRHDDPFKFRFPVGTMIPPGGFLVVFLLDPEDCLADCAADANCAEVEDPLEQAECAAELAECNSRCNPRGLVAGFNLNDAGEALFLFSPDGKLLDRAGVSGQPQDVSNGIDPVTGEYGVIYEPTPGGPNRAVGRKPLRFSTGPLVTNAKADGEPLILDFTVDADAPADIPAAFVDHEVVTQCVAPGAGAASVEADLIDETMTTETRNDFVPETVNIVRWSFRATVPGGSCGQMVGWRVTARDPQDELTQSDCSTLCLEIPTILVKEYQPQNVNFLFVRKRDMKQDTPDWIEIWNHGDKEAKIADVGLVGRGDFNQKEFSKWLFGRNGNIQTICPGGSVLVLADGDGKSDDEYRLIDDTSGTFPFRSTRFALDPLRKGAPDEFALVLPNEPKDSTSRSGGAVIDQVVLRFASGQYTEGQSVGRSEAEGARPHALMPGTVFDVPTPTFESKCESGPSFSPGVAVETKSGLRCPDAGEPATLRVRVSFDKDTPGNQIEAELRFRLNGGAETVAPLVLAKASAGGGSITSTLYETSAVIPGQPADTLVTYSFAAFDRRLEAIGGIGFEDIHSEETDPTSSFQYLVGSRPVGPVRLNEVLPENLQTMLPFTEVLPESQKGFLPEYIELHNSGAAPASLEGFHLTDTLDQARLFRFPAGAVVPPGGFLNVYLGPVPPSLCDCALPPVACGPDAQPCPVGPYIGVESFDFVSEKDEGAVYLVAPDAVLAGANCVVDSLSWSIERSPEDEGDIAVGRICDGADRLAQLTSPTPEASNVLPLIVHDAYHKLIPSLERNVCVPQGASVQLNIVLFLDSRFRELMRGTPGLFTATFFADRGNGEETFSIVDISDLAACTGDLSKDCATPPGGYTAVAIRPRAPLLPPFAATVSYRAVMTACGKSFDAGPFTFGTAAGEHPQVALNEINRFHSVLPGEPARPWIEVWNHGTAEVDLSGMFLSDNPSNPRKTRFPDGTRIPGRSAVLVLTSGTATPPAIGIALNWPKEEGSLFLLDSEARGTCTIDTFPFDFTALDRGSSLGRIPDGTGAIAALAEPSPGIGNESPAAAFIRGDANSDLRVNISDMIRELAILFGGETSRPACEDALDANDDGAINGTDPVHIGNYIFLLGPPIPPPYPLPGEDPTPDGIPACGAMIR